MIVPSSAAVASTSPAPAQSTGDQPPSQANLLMAAAIMHENQRLAQQRQSETQAEQPRQRKPGSRMRK
jgi:hypothetical protein